MAQNYILRWNPNGINQETDAGYAADAARVGGAAEGAVYPSATHNKFASQVSAVCAALAQVLSDKFESNVSDADYAALLALMRNLVTTADLSTGYVIVPYASAISIDGTKGSQYEITLSGNVAACALANPPVGLISFTLIQDAVGGRSWAWPTQVLNGGTPDTAANSRSTQLFTRTNDGYLLPLCPMTTVYL